VAAWPALGACQSLFAPGLGEPLNARRTSFEHLKPGCQGEHCPLVNIDTVASTGTGAGRRHRGACST
jgi:hypothetical protein